MNDQLQAAIIQSRIQRAVEITGANITATPRLRAHGTDWTLTIERRHEEAPIKVSGVAPSTVLGMLWCYLEGYVAGLGSAVAPRLP